MKRCASGCGAVADKYIEAALAARLKPN